MRQRQDVEVFPALQQLNRERHVEQTMEFPVPQIKDDVEPVFMSSSWEEQNRFTLKAKARCSPESCAKLGRSLVIKTGCRHPFL